MKSIATALTTRYVAQMRNQAMGRKLLSGEAIDVRAVGRELEPGLYQLNAFVEGKDYCDAERERWVWSVARRLEDGAIIASLDTRFYGPACPAGHKCIWLR